MSNKPSSRIRRRNQSGFKGEGNHSAYFKGSKEFGDFTDPIQNHKALDYKEANDKRSRVGVQKDSYKLDASGNVIGIIKAGKNRQFNKKYADSHQRA